MAARTADAAAIAAIAAIVATSDPAEAQQIGRAAKQLANWNLVRFRVMEDVLTVKFAHKP